MNIIHYKKTIVAWAPDALSDAINKYSDHNSRVVGPQSPVKQIPKKYDILHIHNKIEPKQLNTAKRSVIQYHSEPYQVNLKLPVNERLVIAQYHATLPEYKRCRIVRNIIDYNNPIYDPFIVNNKFRIGFSPSRRKKMGRWHDKGYDQTLHILNKLKSKHNNVEIDIINGVKLKECLIRKSKCNIIIDECVTKSYHRSGLEGLALGKLTICSLGSDVETIMKAASGAPTIPFVNVWIGDLEKRLSEIIKANDIQNILTIGEDNRKWMEKYWNPKTIVNEFIKIYKKNLL